MNTKIQAITDKLKPKNLKELLFDSEEEEGEKRKQTNTTAMKATVNWGNTKVEPETEQIQQEIETEEEENKSGSSSGERSSQRNRKAPQYYGDAVMICGVENNPEREIIIISSDDNN